MSDPIPLVDIKSQFLRYENEIRSEMESVLANTSFIMGPALVNFEKAFADLCGTRFAIGVSSGLEALTMALRAMGIGPGDEVLLPANTFIATALSVSQLGATPVLVDADASNDLINLELIQKAITPKTKAIIPVHLYGRLVDMKALMTIAQTNNLLVLEDAAQAHGARCNGKAAGSYGKAGAFSFYPGKNLGAFGDGGAITTDDETLAKSIQDYRNYGSDQKYVHHTLGSNQRLDTLQAAVLLAKLRHLDDINRERREVAQRYTQLLTGKNGIELPLLNLDGSHVYHIFPVRVDAKRRDAILAAMQSEKIGASIHYPIPIHLQKAYDFLGYKAGDFPVSEDHASRMISLPIYPEITAEQQQRVCDSLLHHL